MCRSGKREPCIFSFFADSEEATQQKTWFMMTWWDTQCSREIWNFIRLRLCRYLVQNVFGTANPFFSSFVCRALNVLILFHANIVLVLRFFTSQMNSSVCPLANLWFVFAFALDSFVLVFGFNIFPIWTMIKYTIYIQQHTRAIG